MWIGFPVLPSGKHGEQISGPPKASVPRLESAPMRLELKGTVDGVPSAGMPTYFVDQPSSPRVAT